MRKKILKAIQTNWVTKWLFRSVTFGLFLFASVHYQLDLLWQIIGSAMSFLLFELINVW